MISTTCYVWCEVLVFEHPSVLNAGCYVTGMGYNGGVVAFSGDFKS